MDNRPKTDTLKSWIIYSLPILARLLAIRENRLEDPNGVTFKNNGNSPYIGLFQHREKEASQLFYI